MRSGRRKGIFFLSVSCAVVAAAGLLAIITAPPALSGAGAAYFTPRHTGSGVSLSKGKFLVADDSIRDPRFAETVILLVDHGPEGAFGLIINRPTELKLSKVFTDIKGIEKLKDTFCFGGPVGMDQMFLLIRSSSRPGDSLPVFGDVYVSGSRGALQHLVATGKAGGRFRVFAGYAGWGALQLEGEVARGDWHVLPADAENIFEKNAPEIWPALIRRAKAKWVMMPRGFFASVPASEGTRTVFAGIF